jgi:hypothetical protein
MAKKRKAKSSSKSSSKVMMWDGAIIGLERRIMFIEAFLGADLTAFASEADTAKTVEEKAHRARDVMARAAIALRKVPK